MNRAVLLFAIVILAVAGNSMDSLRADDATKTREFFESRIRPVLIEHYKCHSVNHRLQRWILILHKTRFDKIGASGLTFFVLQPSLQAGRPLCQSHLENGFRGTLVQLL